MCITKCHRITIVSVYVADDSHSSNSQGKPLIGRVPVDPEMKKYQAASKIHGIKVVSWVLECVSTGGGQ